MISELIFSHRQFSVSFQISTITRMGAAASVSSRTFRWDPKMNDMNGSDMTSVLQVDIELKRIRKLIKNMVSTAKVGKHLAETEASMASDTFEGTLEEGRKAVGNLRKLVKHVTRVNKIVRIFETIDKDHNNFITEGEMFQFLSKFKAKKEEDDQAGVVLPRRIRHKVSMQSIEEAKMETRKIFQRADYTFDHKLDFHEFYEFMITLFHVAFDSIDTEQKGVIEPSHFDRMIEFIYGNDLGLSPQLTLTPEAKAFTLKRTMQHKMNELALEVSNCPVDRAFFIDYLLFCYEQHHCSRLYYNLMHLAINDSAWIHSKMSAVSDIKTVERIERADEDIDEVEHSQFPSENFKLEVEKKILDSACASPKKKSGKGP